MSQAFQFVPLNPQRSIVKPRKQGLTMLADMGATIPKLQADLELVGGYIDLAKFFAGSIRLYEEDYLVAKLRLYRNSGIRTYAGGGFLEHVVRCGGASACDQYFDELIRIGFDAVEISDQTTLLTPVQRKRMIASAISRGLSPIVELGSKAVTVEAGVIVEQAKLALDSGAELVTVEAAELIQNGEPNTAVIEKLGDGLNLRRILFELPGPGVFGITAAGSHALKRLLIRFFGPDVNLGNVRIDDVFDTEVRRMGFGPSSNLLPGMAQSNASD